MTDALLATLNSLSSLMREEMVLLSQGRWPPRIGELVEAKLRLIGTLERSCAEQERVAPDWLVMLSPAQRKALLDAVSAIREAAAANAATLSRQIDLSRDLLGEIADEARRLGGRTQRTYRRSGELQQRDDLAPVSVNTSL